MHLNGSYSMELTVTFHSAPDYPPETHISSFESTGKDDRRVVQIFWKSIPRLLQNGPGFKYDIQVYENERYEKYRKSAIYASTTPTPYITLNLPVSTFHSLRVARLPARLTKQQ